MHTEQFDKLRELVTQYKSIKAKTDRLKQRIEARQVQQSVNRIPTKPKNRYLDFPARISHFKHSSRLTKHFSQATFQLPPNKQTKLNLRIQLSLQFRRKLHNNFLKIKFTTSKESLFHLCDFYFRQRNLQELHSLAQSPMCVLATNPFCENGFSKENEP